MSLPIAGVVPLSPFTLFRLWRADLSRRRPDTTARLYRRMVFDAGADLGDDPREWTAGQIKRYLENFRAQHANVKRKALSDFTAWMVRNGHRERDPLESVPRPRVSRKRVKRGLTKDELTRLAVAAAWGHKWKPRWAESRYRLALMVIAQYHTGARPGEICRLNTRDVHLDAPGGAYIDIVDTKTGEDRQVPLNRTAVRVFTELVRDRAGLISNLGTKSYWESVSAAAKRAGLPPEKCRPYALRHTFATRLIEKNIHLRVVGDLMGHDDPRSTMGYTVPGEDLRRAAVEELDEDDFG